MAQPSQPPTIYQIRLVLARISPMIWRRLLISSETSVAQLHEYIQTVFDWSGGHLHRFRSLLHCDCQPHETKSFSPLAEVLPERTTPELLFLETKWSSLMSYGLTADLLQEVLPTDSPLYASTIREHVCSVAERLESELGDEQVFFIEGCQRDWNQLPPPDGPLTVGIDGGYIRARNKEGNFEVIAGKSLLAFRREAEGEEELSGKCFAWVQTYDEKPKRRLFEVLQSQGMQMNQPEAKG